MSQIDYTNIIKRNHKFIQVNHRDNTYEIVEMAPAAHKIVVKQRKEKGGKELAHRTAPTPLWHSVDSPGPQTLEELDATKFKTLGAREKARKAILAKSRPIPAPAPAPTINQPDPDPEPVTNIPEIIESGKKADLVDLAMSHFGLTSRTASKMGINTLRAHLDGLYKANEEGGEE